MGRPSKSASVLAVEKKSHRTKSEIKARQDAENAALSGIKIRERKSVKENSEAHKEFLRVKALLTAVGKNDALFEAIINDYCMIKADIERLAERRKRVEQSVDELYEEDDLEPSDRYKNEVELYKTLMSIERQISNLQKKRFDIEKESGFTISSALRAIPKKVEKQSNPLLEALMNDD